MKLFFESALEPPSNLRAILLAKGLCVLLLPNSWNFFDLKDIIQILSASKEKRMFSCRANLSKLIGKQLESEPPQRHTIFHRTRHLASLDELLMVSSQILHVIVGAI